MLSKTILTIKVNNNKYINDGYINIYKHLTNNWLIVEETNKDSKVTCRRSITENEFLELYQYFIEKQLEG